MKAKYLLSLLQNLTLAGRENGEYQWIGTREEWSKVATCPHCQGSGVVYRAYDPEDVVPEICDCQI